MKDKKMKHKEIADRSYDPSDYDKKDSVSEGLAITHEQVSDTLSEGTYDAKIDQVDDNGKLQSHDGEEIKKHRFPKK